MTVVKTQLNTEIAKKKKQKQKQKKKHCFLAAGHFAFYR